MGGVHSSAPATSTIILSQGAPNWYHLNAALVCCADSFSVTPTSYSLQHTPLPVPLQYRRQHRRHRAFLRLRCPPETPAYASSSSSACREKELTSSHKRSCIATSSTSFCNTQSCTCSVSHYSTEASVTGLSGENSSLHGCSTSSIHPNTGSCRLP